MAKILLIISVVLIGVTAYLGFVTKQKVDAMQGVITDKTRVAASAVTDANNAKKGQKKAEDDLLAAKADLDAKEKEVAAKIAEAGTLAAQIKTVGDELAAAKAELAKVPTTPIGEPVDVEKLNAKIAELSRLNADLKGKADEMKLINDQMSQKASVAQSKAQSLDTQVQSYKSNYTRQGLTGTVVAYNPGWNFIVVNIGDRQGLKVGKELVIKRGGQMVGKAKVTSVDPGTSIADILPVTVAKGDSVQPGDSVVYEGRSY